MNPHKSMRIPAIFTMMIIAPSVWSQSSPTISAFWHLDEASGSIVADASTNLNHGSATGTTVVSGVSGNARHFNGSGDYIWVGDPQNGSLDFGADESFTIGVSFRTTSAALQEIVRKGCAPVKGYLLEITGGQVQAVMGGECGRARPGHAAGGEKCVEV